jgi:hypothetical protein
LINYILKRSATKFIAAADKETLYPEKRIGDVHWTKLDDDWFLLPNLWKVRFTTGILVGYPDGSAWGMDEYGRNPGDPLYQDERRRNQEYERFELGKQEWAKRRIGKFLAQVVDHVQNAVADSMARGYQRDQGLLQSEDHASESGS